MTNVYENSLIDELRIEGVNCKGYGIIPKAVMTSNVLTAEAKAIYAYFCSFAGSGNCAFPGRDKILSDLCVAKNTYYRHFHHLTLVGLITAVQESAGGRGQGGGFKKNVYTLVSKPKDFPLPERRDVEDSLRLEGVKAFGYGFIPKAVMTDRRLSIRAKALYAFYAAYTGAGECAYPKKDLILYQLGISANSFNACNRELIALGYIEVRQRIEDGRLSANEYKIIDTPDLSKAILGRRFVTVEKQYHQICDTQNEDTQGRQYTRSCDTQKCATQIEDTQNCDTNINKANINKKKKKQSENQPESPAGEGKTEEEIKIFSEKGISSGVLRRRPLATEAVYILTDYDRLSDKALYAKFKDGDYQHGCFMLFAEALIDMLVKGAKVQGEHITPSDVLERLNRYVMHSGEKFMLDGIGECAIDCYKEGCKATEVKVPLSFMKTCIWNALLTGRSKLDAQILFDGLN